ncbi:MAG: DUF1592 domain-containing protein [Verrucomicrobia bacterium]|nr:DUF1592 domain-containing protein [Verrucomicrobiota bacterium]
MALLRVHSLAVEATREPPSSERESAHSNPHGAWTWPATLLVLIAWGARLHGAELPAAAHFKNEVQPILSKYCFDCHGDGAKKGGVAFDEFKSDDDLLGKRDLWFAALKNLRAGLMPPEKKPRPSTEEQAKLERWIKYEAFGINAHDPDPGRVTVRRLNRVEYHNTIRDLMGFDFKVDDEFPPDDTGYGFDNIGDVLSVSPMLLEKYMQAAETIVEGAVPRVAKAVKEKNIPGKEFRNTADATNNGDRLTFYKAATVTNVFRAELPGDYRVVLELEIAGQFDFDPGRCNVIFKAADREIFRHEFGWQSNKKFRFELPEKWKPGEHKLALELEPLVPAEKKVNSLDLRLLSVKVQGPLDERQWGRPKNFELFFTKDVPASTAGRRKYARELLARFATKAFRRPVDPASGERLAAIAEEVYRQPGKRFEDGVAQAMVAVLASPRFLFRVEETQSGGATVASAFIDEYALATRLSYFLWSTLPDEELFRLAERDQLRKNLSTQVRRMLASAKSDALMQNFTGQWLQVRDVDGIDINARAVLARDNGEEKELERLRQQIRKQQENRGTNRPANPTPEQKAEQEREAAVRRKFFRATMELDGPLRRAMRQETEMCFAHVAREDRSALELLDSDYTFLNEKLAKHYGISNIVGTEMRRVTLPADSARGGLLTQGAVLVVTSNPTRTSPVKRGLFLLDNILGAPPSPPPPDIPPLEDAEKTFKDREPTLKEILALHREKPLCHSCHNRMDPLGLALENFNAMGMQREKERGQTIEVAGKLITGETFNDVRALKRILATGHRQDFYRCLTEKMLTYALGRGMEYYDVETVDQIVARLENAEGRFSALLFGIVESTPFQKRRTAPLSPATKPAGPTASASVTKSKL